MASLTHCVIRTALVNPPDTFSTGYADEDTMPPLGLAYIAAVLRSHGQPADLFDLADMRPLDVGKLEAAGFFDYDVYGFTAYTKCFESALAVLSLLRQRNQRAVVVFGGPHASPCAEDVLREYADIDAVVYSEGEYPMLDLVRHLQSGEPALRTVRNLVYREGGFGDRLRDQPADTTRPVLRCANMAWIQDLDELPFPVRDYVIEPKRESLRYRSDGTAVREVHVVSSRGCPKRCTFCSIVVASPNYRVRSVESLMAEIKALYAEEPFGHVYFTDANFAVSAKRTQAFVRALHEWNPNVTWSGTATADLVLRHAHILEEVGHRNCASLEIGIESGSPTQLKRFNKRTSLADNQQAIALLRRAGIRLGLDFIMFDPESTLTELRENLTFLKQAELFGTSPPACLFNGMRLYPGTPARDKYIRVFGLSGHHLADIQPPFTDPIVAALYGVAQEYFTTYQRVMSEAMVELQRRWRAASSAPAEDADVSNRQRIAALIIELQHEPYRFFDELLTAFETGRGSTHVRLLDLVDLPWGARTAQLLRRAMAALATDEVTAGQSAHTQLETSFAGAPGPEDYVPSPGLVTVTQSESVYLLPLAGSPVRLDFAASFIWRRVARGSSHAAVLAEYAHRFAVGSDAAQAEIAGFLATMERGGHLMRVGSGMNAWALGNAE